MAHEDHRVGSTLAGRYQLTRVIGSGGMATVFQAWDTRLDRFVAVKMFAVGTANDDARRRGEVNLLARLSHPNLVTLHDAQLATQDSGIPSYVVMELVDGPDLRAELDRGALPGRATALIATEIAEALVAVHALGIIHRDLKPANILLAPTGMTFPAYHAKLADFGIAHLVGAERMTAAGLVLGTAGYLSPEQATGAEPGPEADIYALGLVILECFTGARAYPGTIVEATSARLTRDPAIPAELPATWATLLRAMTHREPTARPTAMEVAVTARAAAPALDDWMPIERRPGVATEATVPLFPIAPMASAAGLEPTVRMEAPTQVLPTAPPARSSLRPTRRRWPVIVAASAAALLGVALATSALVGSNLWGAAPAPTHSIPVAPAGGASPDPTITPTPTPSSGDEGNGNGNGDGRRNGNGKGDGNGGGD